LLAVLIALRRQSTTIFADQYTYSGLRLAARALDLQLVPVQMDSQGMSVKHLKSEIKRVGPGTLYLMPSLHNPMAFEMPRDRKRQLALTAKDSGCSIVEDETYRYLIKNPTASMAEVFPEGTVTITTLSKFMVPKCNWVLLAALQHFMPMSTRTYGPAFGGTPRPWRQWPLNG